MQLKKLVLLLALALISLNEITAQTDKNSSRFIGIWYYPYDYHLTIYQNGSYLFSLCEEYTKWIRKGKWKIKSDTLILLQDMIYNHCNFNDSGGRSEKIVQKFVYGPKKKDEFLIPPFKNSPLKLGEYFMLHKKSTLDDLKMLIVGEWKSQFILNSSNYDPTTKKSDTKLPAFDEQPPTLSTMKRKKLNKRFDREHGYFVLKFDSNGEYTRTFFLPKNKTSCSDTSWSMKGKWYLTGNTLNLKSNLNEVVENGKLKPPAMSYSRSYFQTQFTHVGVELFDKNFDNDFGKFVRLK